MAGEGAHAHRRAHRGAASATSRECYGRWSYLPATTDGSRLAIAEFAAGSFDRVEVIRPPARAAVRVDGDDLVLAFRHNGYFADSFVVRVSDSRTARWATATICFDVAFNPAYVPCWG